MPKMLRCPAFGVFRRLMEQICVFSRKCECSHVLLSKTHFFLANDIFDDFFTKFFKLQIHDRADGGTTKNPKILRKRRFFGLWRPKRVFDVLQLGPARPIFARFSSFLVHTTAAPVLFLVTKFFVPNPIFVFFFLFHLLFSLKWG